MIAASMPTISATGTDRLSVTVNPAAALGWSKRVGRLEKGLEADVLVVDSRAPDPYRNLIEGTESNIQMVMVGKAIHDE